MLLSGSRQLALQAIARMSLSGHTEVRHDPVVPPPSIKTRVRRGKGKGLGRDLKPLKRSSTPAGPAQ